MVMVIKRLFLGEHHRLRRQTVATLAERLPWNASATPPEERRTTVIEISEATAKASEMATNWAVPDTRNTQ
jgi:hypothetical protein